MSWRILVVFHDGSTEYVRQQNEETATFTTKRKAQELADSFAEGFDEGEVQSINVVRA